MNNPKNDKIDKFEGAFINNLIFIKTTENPSSETRNHTKRRKNKLKKKSPRENP